MRRDGHLYEKMQDPEVIEEAIRKASRGKRRRKAVWRVLKDIPKHVSIIQNLLETNSFIPSAYTVFDRYDYRNKKYRKIQRPQFFPDQIIHWLIIMACKETFMRGMYHWSCGSLPKRGVHYGVRILKRWLREDTRDTKYALKLDIKKYYDSIPHENLMNIFRNKIKDQRMLNLIQRIVDSTGGDIGIPIGNYTSQWFANVYLEGLDHYIKEQLHVKHYVRYIDDMILTSCNKKELHRVRVKISEYLATNLGLELKHNWQVSPLVSRGIDFLGFVMFSTHTRLRKRNSLALIRQSRKIKELLSTNGPISYKDASGFISRMSSFLFFDSFTIQRTHGNISVERLKNIIREYAKMAQQRHTEVKP